MKPPVLVVFVEDVWVEVGKLKEKPLEIAFGAQNRLLAGCDDDAGASKTLALMLLVVDCPKLKDGTDCEVLITLGAPNTFATDDTDAVVESVVEVEEAPKRFAADAVDPPNAGVTVFVVKAGAALETLEAKLKLIPLGIPAVLTEGADVVEGILVEVAGTIGFAIASENDGSFGPALVWLADKLKPPEKLDAVVVTDV